MATVREATFELFRAHGMTTIFGNPGSTELPMLADFPDDFRYVLGLQEQAVVGMADGFAQASGRPTHVNLHTAPGVGNAMGAIFNAQANQAPLVITAGQQVRPHITIEANLTNRDATVVPHPYVKFSHEPARAQDVPGVLAPRDQPCRARPPRPGVRLDPDGRLVEEADEDRASRALARTVTGRSAPNPDALEALAGRLAAAARPALVPGPEIDASGGWDAAVALAEKQRLPVWATPATGGSRLGFPERHPNFAGILPPAIGPLGEALKEYDLVLVVGSSVFPYYPYLPGPLLAPATELVAITSDPGEAARAPMGDAIVGDVALALERLVELVPAAERSAPQPRPEPGEPAEADPLSGSAAMAALADALPQDAIVVVETPSCTLSLRNRLRISSPAAITSAPAAGSASGSPPRSASSSPSPSDRSCACSGRARRSTESPRCGPRSRTTCRSRSWCCATTST